MKRINVGKRITTRRTYARERTSRANQRLFVLVGLVLIALSYFAVRIWLPKLLFIPITTVNVEASYERINPQAVESVINQYSSQGFLALNIDQLQAQLQELPWVKQAQIWREWPGQLVVKLKQRQALAIWNKSGLIDIDGTLFNPASETYPKGLPLFFASDDKAKLLLRQYSVINTLLVPIHLQVSQLSLDHRSAWDLVLSNGVMVHMGSLNVQDKCNGIIQ